MLKGIVNYSKYSWYLFGDKTVPPIKQTSKGGQSTKSSANRKSATAYLLFLLTVRAYNAHVQFVHDKKSFKITTFVFRHSWAELCGIL